MMRTQEILTLCARKVQGGDPGEPVGANRPRTPGLPESSRTIVRARPPGRSAMVRVAPARGEVGDGPCGPGPRPAARLVLE